MITDLSISNFESHADTQLSFSSGVNVIVGLSDAGKSAIFRAINWTLFNKPSGDAFIRKGAKTARVQVTLDGSVTITRQKGKAGNAYYLGDQLFEAFGSSVPEAIEETINMDRGVNVQAQIDPIFLIQQSPGEIARHWNEAAGLDEIDRSISNLNSQERQTSSRIKEKEKRAGELSEALDAYEGIEGIDERLQQAEALASRLAEVQAQLKELVSRTEKLARAKERVQEYEAVAEYDQEIDKAFSLERTIEEYRSERDILSEATTKYRRTYNLFKRFEEVADREAELGELDKRCDRLAELSQEKERLAKAESKYRRHQRQVDGYERELQALEDKWHEVAPDQCPLCEGAGKLK